MDRPAQPNEHTPSSSKILPWIIVTAAVIAVLILFALPTHQNSAVNSGVFKVSILAAFFGGVFSLLSPCSAALLPAFFAYSFKEKTQLIKMTFVFWLGLATLFVPLGFSASLVSRLFITQQLVFFYIAGGIFILLGLFSLSGKELSFGISAPQFNTKRPVGTIYIMGVLFAFASGTCAAPIIGGIFTLAATQGHAFNAVMLLLAYSLGLVVPMFILAWFFERFNFAGSALVRGKEFTIGAWHVHSTKLITGLIFIAIGLLFIFTRGTNTLLHTFGASGLIDVYIGINDWLLVNAHKPFFIISFIVVVLIGLAMYRKHIFHSRNV